MTGDCGWWQVIDAIDRCLGLLTGDCGWQPSAGRGGGDSSHRWCCQAGHCTAKNALRVALSTRNRNSSRRLTRNGWGIAVACSPGTAEGIVAACSPGTGTAAACCKDNTAETHALTEVAPTACWKLRRGGWRSEDSDPPRLCVGHCMASGKGKQETGPACWRTAGPADEENARIGPAKTFGFLGVPHAHLHKTAVVHTKKARRWVANQHVTRPWSRCFYPLAVVERKLRETPRRKRREGWRSVLTRPLCCTWKRLRVVVRRLHHCEDREKWEYLFAPLTTDPTLRLITVIWGDYFPDFLLLVLTHFKAYGLADLLPARS